MLAHEQPKPSKALVYLRLAANIIGTAFVVFVFFMNFADLPENPPPIEAGAVVMLGGMVVVALGTLLAWKWSLVGAVLMLLGYGSFEAVQLLDNEELAAGLFLLIPLLALIHLIYWERTRQ